MGIPGCVGSNLKKMDFIPPIKERSNNELYEIIENREGWEPEAFDQAQSELIKRGISIEKQNNRRKSNNKYNSRIKKLKSTAFYTPNEFALLIVFGWPLCLIFNNLEIFYPGEGFERKNRQGILLAFFGLVFWLVVLFLVIQYS